MKARRDNRRFWQTVDGYKGAVAVVLALMALFLLLVTIMPIILFQTLEDASWELKTFATSYRPLAALIGLVLFLATGWAFLRVVRGPQMLPTRRRRTTKPAEAAPTPGEDEQTGWSLERLLRNLHLPWRRQEVEKPMESADQLESMPPSAPEPKESTEGPEKAQGTGR